MFYPRSETYSQCWKFNYIPGILLRDNSRVVFAVPDDMAGMAIESNTVNPNRDCVRAPEILQYAWP